MDSGTPERIASLIFSVSTVNLLSVFCLSSDIAPSVRINKKITYVHIYNTLNVKNKEEWNKTGRTGQVDWTSPSCGGRKRHTNSQHVYRRQKRDSSGGRTRCEGFYEVSVRSTPAFRKRAKMLPQSISSQQRQLKTSIAA